MIWLLLAGGVVGLASWYRARFLRREHSDKGSKAEDRELKPDALAGPDKGETGPIADQNAEFTEYLQQCRHRLASPLNVALGNMDLVLQQMSSRGAESEFLQRAHRALLEVVRISARIPEEYKEARERRRRTEH